MKICARCGMKLKDEQEFCARCGGNNFKAPQPKPQNQPSQNGQPVNINKPNVNAQQNNPQNMQNNMQMQQMQQMQQNANVQQQGGGVFKSLFKSPKQKKAEMEAEMAMMRQMQQQKQAQQAQQATQNQQMQQNGQNVQQNMNGGNQNRVVKPGQRQGNAALFNNNTFSDVQPDLSTKEWIQILFLLMIPLFNIYYIVTGMNNPMNVPYKQNFLRAFGIYYAISFGVSIILALIITLTTM